DHDPPVRAEARVDGTGGREPEKEQLRPRVAVDERRHGERAVGTLRDRRRVESPVVSRLDQRRPTDAEARIEATVREVTREEDPGALKNGIAPADQNRAVTGREESGRGEGDVRGAGDDDAAGSEPGVEPSAPV